LPVVASAVPSAANAPAPGRVIRVAGDLYEIVAVTPGPGLTNRDFVLGIDPPLGISSAATDSVVIFAPPAQIAYSLTARRLPGESNSCRVWAPSLGAVFVAEKG
jgi:hypothetical protein